MGDSDEDGDYDDVGFACDDVLDPFWGRCVEEGVNVLSQNEAEDVSHNNVPHSHSGITFVR